MNVVGRQFGNPRGPLGRLVGRAMLKGNAGINRWVVDCVARGGSARRVVELGSGPGLGLGMLLEAFPEAEVWGVDPSPVMVAQAERRNAGAIREGRLHVVRGDVSTLAGMTPVDLVVAVHVLYFWHEPRAELAGIKAALAPGGRLALGFRLRADMPKVSQKQFPAEGHLLYDSVEEVEALVREAGFGEVESEAQGSPDGGPSGRIVVGRA